MWEWLVNYGGFLGLPSMKDISTIPKRYQQWAHDPAWEAQIAHQRMGIPRMNTDFIAEVPSVQEYRRGLLDDTTRADDQKRKDDFERFQRDRMQRFLRK